MLKKENFKIQQLIFSFIDSIEVEHSQPRFRPARRLAYRLTMDLPQ